MHNEQAWKNSLCHNRLNHVRVRHRVDHLTGATSGGLNESNLLTASTVFDDAAVDELYGEGNQDWFLYGSSGANRDVLRDRKSDERTTTV